MSDARVGDVLDGAITVGPLEAIAVALERIAAVMERTEAREVGMAIMDGQQPWYPQAWTPVPGEFRGPCGACQQTGVCNCVNGPGQVTVS
jgi:hypothetical protein